MNVPLPVVIVGGGIAGVSTAMALRAGGYAGPVVLVDRAGLPYDRPPLSKGYLSGDLDAAQLHLQPAQWYADHDVAVVGEAEAVDLALDPAAVTLSDGRILRAEWIVLATGGTARRPALPGGASPRVHVLRERADADRLRAVLVPGARLLVVGGGLLGSEVASAARARGVDVVLADPLDPPHAAALGPDLAAWLHTEHAARGVRTLATSLVALEDSDGGIDAELANGERLRGLDAVLVAVGMVPETTLARRAGLAVDDGILVDVAQETSHPRILAVGDSSRVRGQARAEHWDAARLAGQRAAATILGQAPPPSTAPWFWSDRHGRHVEVVGELGAAPGRAVVTRGIPGPGPFSVWTLERGRIVGAASVDDPVAARAARRLVDRRVAVDPARLADPGSDLRALLRGATATAGAAAGDARA